MGLGGIAGGQSMGHAFGRISIDTSGLNQAKVTIRSVAQEAEKGFSRIGGAARSAQTTLGGLASKITAIAGPFGIEFGAAGVAQLARFMVAATNTATAFERQSVAAIQLAGSQAKLNSLMVAYDEATGGAVDKATALANVTRLQAVGFADSAEELTRFVTVASGVALAMGKSQDYVISQMQLSIANQSTMRLDQIGLGVSEVKRRVDELRTSNSALTTEMAYQEAVLSIAEEKYGALAKSAEAQATGAEKAAKAGKDFRLELGLLVDSPVGESMQGLADSISAINVVLGLANEQLDRFGGGLERIGGLSEVWRQASVVLNPIGFLRGEIVRNINEYGDKRQSASIGGSGLGDTNTSGTGRGYTGTPVDFKKHNEAIRDWADQVQTIERDAASTRLDATRQFESQRSEAIAQYEKTITRDAQDFARQRARQEQQLARQIAEVREDAADREREWQADYTEKVTEIHADANERIAEIEEDYARNREKAQRDHRDTLLSAAGRLDAQAILAEKRRYERESQNADEQHRDRIGDERGKLQKRIDDEAKAHEKRLRLAREAEAERIKDMQDASAEARRIEDEDRAVRLGRQAEDHAANLDKLAHNHAESMIKIEQDLAAERTELNNALQADLTELGVHRDAWLTAQKEKQAESLRLFCEFMNDVVTSVPGNASAPWTQGLPEYQTGGSVAHTGLAKLHAGEYVLNPTVTRTLNDMMGGMSQRGLIAAMAGGTRSTSISMSDGAIQVFAAPGESSVETAIAVRQELESFFQEMAH